MHWADDSLGDFYVNQCRDHCGTGHADSADFALSTCREFVIAKCEAACPTLQYNGRADATSSSTTENGTPKTASAAAAANGASKTAAVTASIILVRGGEPRCQSYADGEDGSRKRS